MIERLNAALEGRYRIASELGEGGMATVFLAEDLRHDRRVAIKVLKPELAAVIGGERFVAEIKTTAALQHPHILPLFDSGAEDGFLYYVMPYVDGESLRNRLDREKQLNVAESVRIAAAVASALQYAHDQGIIHRDIKPANILIHAGEPVVADFGIALAISRTGDVAYLARVDGREQIRLRRAVDPQPVDVPNTTGAGALAFSPAGDWLAFTVDERELRKVQLATGTSVTVMTSGSFPVVWTPEWSDDGWILFGTPDGIYRVPEAGGEPERVVEGTPTLFPRLLPGGRLLLYTEMPTGSPDGARVMVRDLTTGDSIVIAGSGGNAVWSPTGHILYGHRSASIFAVPFDLRRRTVTGPPVPVQENVASLGAISQFQLSGTGSLAYLGGGGTSLGDPDSQSFAWMEPDGTTVRVPTDPIDPTDHADSRISPDGRQLAYTSGGYIHIFDLTRGTNQRLTFEGEDYRFPVWSPDGRRLAFTAARDGGDGGDIFVKDVDGRSRAELVVGMEGLQYAMDWLEDGTLVFMTRAEAGAQWDIFMTRLGSDGDPVPLLAAEWDETAPRVSPDRRLLAYNSTETGQRHLFVREFPGMGGRWQVSERPVQGLVTWSLSGDALVYRDGGSNRLIRADLELEPTVQVLRRTELSDQFVGEVRDVHPGDGRILLSRPVGMDVMDTLGDQDFEIMVVANWLTELRDRLGGR